MRLAKDLIYSYLEASQGIRKQSGDLIVGLDVFKHLGIQDDILSCIKMNNMLLYKENYEEFLRLTKPAKPPQPQLDQTVMTNKIKNKLSDMGVTTELLNFIISLDGCISGSTILSTILDEDWEKRDLDVYTSQCMLLKLFNDDEMPSSIECMYEKFINRLTSFGFKAIDHPRSKHNKRWSYYLANKDVSRLITINKGDLEIDFVMVQCTPRECIKKFDFSFNSVYFDGNSVSIMDIKNFQLRQSLNQYIFSDCNSDEDKFKKNWDRIKKYMERGFIILLDNKNDEFYKPNYDIMRHVDIKSIKSYVVPEKIHLQEHESDNESEYSDSDNNYLLNNNDESPTEQDSANESNNSAESDESESESESESEQEPDTNLTKELVMNAAKQIAQKAIMTQEELSNEESSDESVESYDKVVEKPKSNIKSTTVSKLKKKLYDKVESSEDEESDDDPSENESSEEEEEEEEEVIVKPKATVKSKPKPPIKNKNKDGSGAKKPIRKRGRPQKK